MPYLRKGELRPVKGYDLSAPPPFIQEGYGFPLDMQYDRGEMRKRDGKSKIGQPSFGNQAVLHLSNFDLSTLVSYLIMHTKRNVYKYNTSTDAFDDVTGLNDLSGDDGDFFDSCVVAESDMYIFTNYINNVRKLQDPGTSTDLGGTPQKAKFCEYITPYVFLANLNENGVAFPTKGKWCDTGNPENWTTGNAGSHLFTDDTSEIRRVKKLGEYVFVYKGGMSYRGFLVSTSDIFNFIIHSTGKGLYAPRAVAEADQRHFYMGTNDFHVNNGVRIDDIGGPVREFIFNRLDRTKNETCFALHVEQFKEIWFFITVAGSSWPTEVWKYKYDLGFWYRDVCNNISAAGNYKRISTVRWLDLIGTWLQQTWRWSDQAGQADAPIQVFGRSNGLVLQRDQNKRDDFDAVYTGREETRDFCGLGPDGQPSIEQDQNWYQFDFFASGTTVDVYYSVDEGSTWSFIETKTLDSTMKKRTTYIDVVTPKIRFKVENSSALGQFTFRSAIPYYLDAGLIEAP